MRQSVNLVKFFPFSPISYQLELIADPYSDHKFRKKMIQRQKKKCLKCKKNVHPMELHKLVMYVIEEEFTEHHYEHVECPEKFTV